MFVFVVLFLLEASLVNPSFVVWSIPFLRVVLSLPRYGR